MRGLSGAEYRVFGAERLVFPPSGAFLRDFGAERQVFLLFGAEFRVFGAAGLPGLRRGVHTLTVSGEGMFKNGPKRTYPHSFGGGYARGKGK